MAKPEPGTVAVDGTPRIKEFRGAKTDAGRTIALVAEGRHWTKRNMPDLHQQDVDRDELGDRVADALRDQNRR